MSDLPASIPTDGPGVNMSQVFAPFYWGGFFLAAFTNPLALILITKLGFVISAFLGGITIVQAYLYFPRSTDRPIVKSIAATMLIFDLVSSALVAQSLYYYLVPHYGSLSQLGSITPELSAECLLSTLITFISQMYFVYQIYAIKHIGKLAWFLIIIISAGAFLAFAGGVGCVATMYVFHHGVLSHRNGKFAIFFGLAKGFGSITDIIATTAMCYLLTSSTSGVSKQTSGLIKSLITFVVNRGVLVTLIQTLLLITFYASEQELYWLAFHINVTKLYANTFFAMLNGRDHIRQKHANKSGIGSSYVSSLRIPTDPDPERSYIHAQADHKSYEMPTVTKTVHISGM
ncbi:hypothetical protein V5O48_005333 [Marasmius crinis-equi]|uniref:DUF6534 domain-containing protein n=1 Tax=Marasmius crinis-equi TaxID=585013 RepID=A0ABR3FMK4_9AGAR